MKKTLVKIGLKLCVWLFDLAYDYIDSDKDGKLSKEEIYDVAEHLDQYSRNLVKILNKR